MAWNNNSNTSHVSCFAERRLIVDSRSSLVRCAILPLALLPPAPNGFLQVQMLLFELQLCVFLLLLDALHFLLYYFQNGALCQRQFHLNYELTTFPHKTGMHDMKQVPQTRKYIFRIGFGAPSWFFPSLPPAARAYFRASASRFPAVGFRQRVQRGSLNYFSICCSRKISSRVSVPGVGALLEEYHTTITVTDACYGPDFTICHNKVDNYV